MNVICSDCGSTNVESCLCHKCIQKVINNANSLGKKQGQIEKLDECKVQFYRLTTEKFLKWLNDETKKLKKGVQ